MAGGEIACFAVIFYLDTREFFVKPGDRGQVNSGCPGTDKGASPLVPSCTVHALFQPGQHIAFLFLAILGQPELLHSIIQFYRIEEKISNFVQ
jgi:hypothetical protein